MEIEYLLQDINKAAARLLEKAEQQTCFAFFAEMGAGKTTLIQALCKKLNVVDTISSPTYSIINEYRTKKNELVVHMDWYRLKGESDALNAGVEDYILGAHYCFIEWPQRAVGLLPTDCLQLSIESLDEQKRVIRTL